MNVSTTGWWAKRRAKSYFLVTTVHAETITELSLTRAGPVIFMISLPDLRAFRPIPVICPARRAKPENYWKRILIPDRASPASFSEISSWKHFLDPQ